MCGVWRFLSRKYVDPNFGCETDFKNISSEDSLLRPGVESAISLNDRKGPGECCRFAKEDTMTNKELELVVTKNVMANHTALGQARHASSADICEPQSNPNDPQHRRRFSLESAPSPQRGRFSLW